MTALLSPNAKQQFFTDGSTVAAGYRLYTYAANTINPQATYTNRAGTVANANPIILDARGEATIYLTPGVVYDYVLETPLGSPVWTREDVSAQAGEADAVFFDDALAPAYLKTVSDLKQGDPVWVGRNIDRSKHASLRAGTLGDDLTLQINELLEEMGSVGYGVLQLGTGVHKVTNLVLPGGVSIVGEGWEPYTAYATTGTLGKGSVLHVNNPTGAGILVQKRTGGRTSGASVRRVAMQWTHATPGGGWTPTVYDWAIKIDRADDVTIEDVLLLNPYKGIQITGVIGEAAGRMNLHRVFGQPLLTGVEIDLSVDVSSLERVHFWPFWTGNATVLAWMMANNATFLKSNRNDNCELSNIFGYGYARGIHIGSHPIGTTLRMRGQNIDFDNVARAFYVDSTAAASSGSFTNFHATANPATAGADLFVSEADGVDYNFANLRLSNSQKESVKVTGNNAQFRLANFWADQWNILAAGHEAVEAGAACRVDVINGKFTQGNGGAIAGGSGSVSCDEWIDYTATATPGSGTFTSAAVTLARYRRRGNQVDVLLEVTITTNGTAATSVIASLPFVAASPAVLAGRERNATGKGVMGQILTAGTSVAMTLSADNGYPGGNGTVITLSGSYQVA